MSGMESQLWLGWGAGLGVRVVVQGKLVLNIQVWLLFISVTHNNMGFNYQCYTGIAFSY